MKNLLAITSFLIGVDRILSPGGIMRKSKIPMKLRVKILLRSAFSAHATGVLTGISMVGIFVVLGGLLTSSVHLAAYGQWEWLHGQAMLAIGLPAFVTGWTFSLLIPVLIRRRRIFVSGAMVFALLAAALHRLIFVSRALTWQTGSVDVLGELEQNVYACVNVLGGGQWCIMKPGARLDFFALDWTLGAQSLAVILAGVLAYMLHPWFWDRMARRNIETARHPRL
jgi:hypothetical protein